MIQISLIPFTLQHTTLGERQAGDRVHLEADTIGKYVAQLLRAARRSGSVMSTFGTIEQAIDDLRNGKIIIVADDEDRENEGDLVCAAELVDARDDQLHDPARARAHLPGAHRASAATSSACRR